MSTEELIIEGVVTRPLFGSDPRRRAGKDGSLWYLDKGGRWQRMTIRRRNGQVYAALNRTKANPRSGTRSVGALVLTAFGVPRPPKSEALHYPDPDPENNALDNLRWAPRGTSLLGRKGWSIHIQEYRATQGAWYGHNRKIKPEQFPLIKALWDSGATARDIAEELGLKVGCVSHLVSGRTYKGIAPVFEKRPALCGSFVGVAKLDEIDVLKIRRMAAQGVRPRAIAKKYKVKDNTIRDIIRGRTWSHVPEADPEYRAAPLMGSRTNNAKLTEGQVRSILIALDQGAVANDLARKYGVDASIITGIRHGKIWKHVAEQLYGDAAPTIPASRHQSKLTEGQVRSILIALDQGAMARDLARKYGVHSSIISAIRRGKIWKHVAEQLYGDAAP
jgi:DNA-binding MarR family transcriptional regulator